VDLDRSGDPNCTSVPNRNVIGQLGAELINFYRPFSGRSYFSKLYGPNSTKFRDNISQSARFQLMF